MSHFDRTTTEGAARYFQNCIRSGNVEGAMSCFDEQAVYVAAPDDVVKGTTEIRKKIEVLCAMKPNLQAKRSVAYETGDLAAWVDEWVLQATLPDGTALDLKGVSSDILKRLPSGIWVYLVDNPYGADVLNQGK